MDMHGQFWKDAQETAAGVASGEATGKMGRRPLVFSESLPESWVPILTLISCDSKLSLSLIFFMCKQACKLPSLGLGWCGGPRQPDPSLASVSQDATGQASPSSSPAWLREGGSRGGGGPVEGGAELEKPAGLEQFVQAPSSLLCLEAAQGQSLPPRAPGVGARRAPPPCFRLERQG